MTHKITFNQIHYKFNKKIATFVGCATKMILKTFNKYLNYIHFAKWTRVHV